jgi:hypothetical protein
MPDYCRGSNSGYVKLNTDGGSSRVQSTRDGSTLRRTCIDLILALVMQTEECTSLCPKGRASSHSTHPLRLTCYAQYRQAFQGQKSQTLTRFNRTELARSPVKTTPHLVALGRRGEYKIQGAATPKGDRQNVQADERMRQVWILAQPARCKD